MQVSNCSGLARTVFIPTWYFKLMPRQNEPEIERMIVIDQLRQNGNVEIRDPKEYADSGNNEKHERRHRTTRL